QPDPDTVSAGRDAVERPVLPPGIPLAPKKNVGKSPAPAAEARSPRTTRSTTRKKRVKKSAEPSHAVSTPEGDASEEDEHEIDEELEQDSAEDDEDLDLEPAEVT